MDFGTTDGREGEKRMLQARGRMLAWNHNIIPMSASQPSTGLSLSEIPRPTAEALQTFAAFKGGEAAEAFRSLATFTGEETERENQGAPSIHRFRSRVAERLAEFGRGMLRNYVEERDRDNGPLRRDGGIQATEPTSKT